MTHLYPHAFFDDGICPLDQAKLSIASSAVLYGLSVYTVFPVHVSAGGQLLAFRLDDHFERLVNSARIIGIDTFKPAWTKDRFSQAARDLLAANHVSTDVFIRVAVHVDELLAGTRSRGLATKLSMFAAEAAPVIPLDGARLKTSVWRRVPDYAIPSRAKVNGAYVNSVLAKQDALDSGYDDCIFLDAHGHVCELSAANIFMVRNDTLITPGTTSDLLEGISRRTILEVARNHGIDTLERDIDLTELYIADEVFACGTSAYIAPVTEIDARLVARTVPGPITKKLLDIYTRVLRGEEALYAHLLTDLTPTQAKISKS